MAGKWRSWIFGAALAGVAALLGAADAPPPTPPASPPPIVQIGTAYFAKQYCSCLLVAGRSETSCHAEFKPLIDSFKITVDRTGLPQSAKVSTRLGTAEGQAIYDRRYGCVLSK
jgi:hypothetical protein